MEAQIMKRSTALLQKASFVSLLPSLENKGVFCEFSKSFVQLVDKGSKMPLRSLKNAEKAKTMILAAVIKIAKSYGARNRSATQEEAQELKDMLKECVEITLQKFSHLGIEEIQEAYRQHAAEETKAKGAEMYYGELNVTNYTRVLSAYNQKRMKVAAYLLDVDDDLKREAHEQKQKEKWSKTKEGSYKKYFAYNLVKNRNLGRYGAKSWRDMQTKDYDGAIEFNYIQFKDKSERIEIFERAKKIWKTDIQKQLADSGKTHELKHLKKTFELGLEPDSAKAQQKVIARKICLYEKALPIARRELIVNQSSAILQAVKEIYT